jgi:hypothetical protein
LGSMTFSVKVGKLPASAVAEESKIAVGVVRRRRNIKLLHGVFLRRVIGGLFTATIEV